MRMIVDHLTIILIDIVVDAHEVCLSDNREVVWMLSSISSRVMLHDLITTATKSATTFIWITLHNMGEHGLIDCMGDVYYETCICSMSYHNSFASNSSSSLLMSRVHRSSLRYFQP